MRLYKWLFWDFPANSSFRAIDRQLDVLLLESAVLTEESRTRLSALMVNMLPKLIKNYDFRRSFYAQFAEYALKNDPSHMAKLTDVLNSLQNKAIDVRDIEAELMLRLLKSFTMLHALKTQSAYAMRLRGKILHTRGRNMNDIVQHFLATKLNELAENWQESEVF